MTIDNRDGRNDPLLDQVMSDHIPYGIYDLPLDQGEDTVHIRAKYSKRLPEQIPPAFGQQEHRQRTFRAYLPGREIFIFFATSECRGSMMTRYPVQSLERFALPQTAQLSPSTTRWQSLQT